MIRRAIMAASRKKSVPLYEDITLVAGYNSETIKTTTYVYGYGQALSGAWYGSLTPNSYRGTTLNSLAFSRENTGPWSFSLSCAVGVTLPTFSKIEIWQGTTLLATFLRSAGSAPAVNSCIWSNVTLVFANGGTYKIRIWY